MEKLDLFGILYKKIITQKDAEEIYVCAFDKFRRGTLTTDPINLLCLSRKEQRAILMRHTSLNILTKWRHTGWPSMCAVCGKRVSTQSLDWVVFGRKKIGGSFKKKGIPFTDTDVSGANALHAACGADGSIEAVRFLVENNILTDINAKTDENETPFLLAVMYDHTAIVKYFFKNLNPNVMVTTIYGDTPLSLAQKNANAEICGLIETKLKTKKRAMK